MNYFNYFSEIESVFIRRRGRNLLLSPLDWAQIEKWRDQGIPLRIVLRGINRVFDKFDKDPAVRRGIKSLAYCREEIEAQHAEWLESQVGSGRGGLEADAAVSETQTQVHEHSSEAVAEHLKSVSSGLANAIGTATGELLTVLKRAEKSLAEISDTAINAADLDAILENLDASIDQFLRESLASDQLKREVDEEMALYAADLGDDVARRTYEFMLSRKLREIHRVPRFSLLIL